MIVTRERCFICGNMTDFCIPETATLFREAVCCNCGASLRNSDLAKTLTNVILQKDLSLSEALIGFQKLKILEAASYGPVNRLLRQLPGYICFEYFDDVKLGETKEGVLCNDFENLTFEDDSFDLILSQDVLEHVAKPNKAFSEINRVLKKGGHHIFTVPLHEGRPSLSRANLVKVYHGDPLRNNGSLVYTDWGDDICSLIDNYGMSTERIDVHRFFEPSEITNVDETYDEYLSKEHLDYFRYNSVVFISKKV